MKKNKVPFDKYLYYRMTVQNPEHEVDFLSRLYHKIFGAKPKVLREDFCGTFSLCCEWVKFNKNNVAIGYDLDNEPLQYGYTHYFSQLTPAEQKRVNIFKKDVCSPGLKSADIIVAFNFSYLIFKRREQLKLYFQRCFHTLNKKGLFILDLFGGKETQQTIEEETYFTKKKYSYYWDEAAFNPISQEALFHIHFKRDGEKKRHKVFTYDWRLWSIPELKDILQEVGFENIKIYWERSTSDDEGSGIFYPAKNAAPCEAWVAYIVCIK